MDIVQGIYEKVIISNTNCLLLSASSIVYGVDIYVTDSDLNILSSTTDETTDITTIQINTPGVYYIFTDKPYAIS